MKLKEIEFPNVCAASGSLNFFGDGCWYHKWYKLIFPGFKKLSDCTFIAKTTTLNLRKGNMALKENLQPRKLLPDCIKVYPLKGVILNAVGLSGPGAEILFKKGLWQKINKPFFISFMAVGNTAKERLKEAKKFVDLMRIYLPGFKAPVGIQVNLSCPNTEHLTSELSQESINILKVFSILNIPVDLKINTLFSIKLLKEIEKKKLCDVITISNTIPYGTYKYDINWKKLLNSKKSPLLKYGGGGLSGKEILPIVINRIKKVRESGITMPIKGSGGIMSERDVELMKFVAGVNGVEFATAAMIRPWRVKRIILKAEEIFS